MNNSRCLRGLARVSGYVLDDVAFSVPSFVDGTLCLGFGILAGCASTLVLREVAHSLFARFVANACGLGFRCWPLVLVYIRDCPVLYFPFPAASPYRHLSSDGC